jgi:hypothetical protein
VDVEAVGEHQQLALAEVGRDVSVVDRLLDGVGHEDHDRVRLPDGIVHVGHPEPRLLRQRPALGARGKAHDHLDARLVEIERVGVTLAAVAHDRDRLPREDRRIGVVVVVHAGGHRTVPSPGPAT